MTLPHYDSEPAMLILGLGTMLGAR